MNQSSESSQDSNVPSYYELWDEMLSQFGENLPEIIDQGLATVREKLSLDDLGTVNEGHDEILELKRRLKYLDGEYEKILIESKQRKLKPTVQNDALLRITDFLQGIVVAIHNDYSEDPTLIYLMQQLYLVQKGSLKS